MSVFFVCLIIDVVFCQLKDKDFPLFNELTMISQKYNEEVIVPRFCVVGIASAGKSTLINLIIGHEIIPRAVRTCTRCPLQITLNNGTFSGDFIMPDGQNKTYNNAHGIYEHIHMINKKLEEDGRFSNVPINLVLHAPNARNIMLVDLPGMISNGVDKEIVDKMVEDVITDPHTLILAVLSSETIPENNKAWELIKKVDPERNRTIGVYTKVNLIQPSDLEEKLKIVDNAKEFEYHLKLGWFPVVLRSENNQTLNESIKAEKDFLRKNKPFHRYSDIFGLENVCSALSRVWEKRVQDYAPRIIEQTVRMLEIVETQLEKCDNYKVPKDADGQYAEVLKFIFRLKTEYEYRINPTQNAISIISDVKYSDSLRGGALILRTISEEFSDEIFGMNCSLGDLDSFHNQILNAQGATDALFFPENAFRLFCKKLILSLRDPSLEKVKAIFNICLEIVKDSLDALERDQELNLYPELKDHLFKQSEVLLEKKWNETKNVISKYFEAENGYVNVRHRRFNPFLVIYNTARKHMSEEFFSWLKNQPSFEGSKENSPDELVQHVGKEVEKEWFYALGTLKTKEMRMDAYDMLVETYYGIVQDTVVDVVPKIIMMHLVYASVSEIQDHLSKVKREEAGHLINADPVLISECTNLSNEKISLKGILERLKELKESSVTLSVSPQGQSEGQRSGSGQGRGHVVKFGQGRPERGVTLDPERGQGHKQLQSQKQSLFHSNVPYTSAHSVHVSRPPSPPPPPPRTPSSPPSPIKPSQENGEGKSAGKPKNQSTLVETSKPWWGGLTWS